MLKSRRSKRKLDDGFSSEDNSEDDSEYKDNLKKRKYNSKFYDNKTDELDKLSRDKNIEIQDILDLNLSDNDNLWFYEYINIRESSENEEQRFEIKNKIYDKYELIKKIQTDKLKNINIREDENIINKILNSPHTNETKQLLINYVKNKIENSNSEEYQKIIELINVVLQIPIKIKNNYKLEKVSSILSNLETVLDKKMYGMENVKLKILQSMCSILCSGSNSGKILTLVGPPGVGKTAICSIIADAMNLPFSNISLGTIKDPHDLCGHSSTYIASKPGIFLNILRKSGQLDNLILLDEIDKIYDNNNGNSITSILIHILDSTQNNKIRDAYCQDFSFDLSKVFFILSCNDITKIDKVLKDRLEIVNINGYTVDERTEIACKHVIPSIINKYNLNKNDFIIEKDNIKDIINTFDTNDEKYKLNGVRGIIKLFNDIFEKILLNNKIPKSKYVKIIGFDQIKYPININKSLISKTII